MVIYETTNLINGMRYIGKDRNNISCYLGGGVLLREAFKTFGKENFKKEILEICFSVEELKERELYWLNYYDVANNSNFYNITNKSNGGGVPTKTQKYLDRGAAISKGRQGNHYILASIALKGILKPGTSEALKDRPKTEEHKKNLSDAKMGIPSKRKGKPDLKQRGKPKPGAGGKGKPHMGAGPKEGKYIIDNETGVIYKSVKEVLEMFGFHKRKMYNILKEENGRFKYLIR